MSLMNDLKQCLCPPGEGVYTVNTAKERKESLHQAYYQKTGAGVRKNWEEQISKIENEKRPLLIGITSDCGGGIMRGANWGPLVIRQELIEKKLKNSYLDIGDIRTIPHLLHDKYLNQETLDNCKEALYGSKEVDFPVSPLSLTEFVCDQIYQAKPNAKILALGGDHSVSYPLTKSFLKHKKNQGKRIGIIHFDAHTDLLDTRLGIDLCFGSWAFHIMDDLNHSKDLIQIGIRSTGKTKEHWENKVGVQQIWAEEVKDIGAEKVAQNIQDYLKQQKIDEIYLSFDIDALDETIASSTGTPEPKGLFPHEAILIIKKVAKICPISGADLVEVAPFVNFKPANVVSGQKTLMSAGQILANILEEML